MKITTPETAASDERGSIKDILVGQLVDSITVITSKKGVVRGNHYHKETIQWVYLHSGKMKSLSRIEGGAVISKILKPGDVLVNEPNEHHALIALEESLFYVFTHGPRSGKNYEHDTYKLDAPLTDSKEALGQKGE